MLSLGHQPYAEDAPSLEPTLPFVFHLNGEPVLRAENPGLEGFIHAEERFRRRFGAESSAALLPSYLRYLGDLLAPLPELAPTRIALESLDKDKAPSTERLSRLLSLVHTVTTDLQDYVRAADPATWVRGLRAYHIYTSVTPLNARRMTYLEEAYVDPAPYPEVPAPTWFTALSSEDLMLLREYGFNAIRLMGTYPRGLLNRKGESDGSPFSVTRYAIDPALGTDEEVRAKVLLAESLGIRTLFEFVPNHTAVDADLVREDPTLYVHTFSRPTDEHGYFRIDHPERGEMWIRHGAYHDQGGRHYFTDTLQLDLSNPETCKRITAWAVSLFDRYGIHGLRLDMAHHILDRNFHRCWGDELSNPESSREFLEEFVRAIKERHPSAALLGEVLGGTPVEFEDLAGVGLDLIYNLDHLPVRGGALHTGWFQALLSRDPAVIARAFQRAHFLNWQQGSAGAVAFVGQHDRPAPWREFGDWVWGALFLTVHQPGPLCLYAGTEAHFEAPCPEDGKMISFSHPQVIDWRGVFSDFGEYLHHALLDNRRLRETLGDYLEMHPLYEDTLHTEGRPDGFIAAAHQSWVGFALTPPRRGGSSGRQQFNGTLPEGAPFKGATFQGAQFKGALVVANLGNDPKELVLSNLEIGLAPTRVSLGSRGPNGQAFIVIP